MTRWRPPIPEGVKKTIYSDRAPGSERHCEPKAQTQVQAHSSEYAEDACEIRRKDRLLSIGHQPLGLFLLQYSLSSAELQRLLRIPAKVVNLHIFDDADLRLRLKLLNRLTLMPEGYSRALLPYMNSLRSLTIHTILEDIWDGMESAMDLTEFNQLRFLRISMEMLMKGHAACTS